MNEQVNIYIEAIKLPWQAEICRQLRGAVLESIPDAEERIQYGKPHYLKNGRYTALMGTAKGWVSFTIFNARTLDTPEGLFEESENGDRKTIKIREGQEVDYELLAGLIREAVASL
jgi:hypothetical protein